MDDYWKRSTQFTGLGRENKRTDLVEVFRSVEIPNGGLKLHGVDFVLEDRRCGWHDIVRIEYGFIYVCGFGDVRAWEL